MKAGGVIHFISETVMIGFKAGIALVLASTQLPKLCGFGGAHGGSFWERMRHFLENAGATNLLALTVGLAALVVLLLGKRFLPGKPVAILVVVGGILAAKGFELGTSGVAPRRSAARPAAAGRPGDRLGRPERVPASLVACFLLGAIETAAIGRTFAQKHGYRLDSDREFLALGAANLASGLGGGFPISGGMSQSLVNESGGARTPLSGLVAAILMLVVALSSASWPLCLSRCSRRSS